MFCRIGLLLAAVMFSPVLNAQVKLELLLGQDQFLVKESVEIGVRVVNHSGQTLNLKKVLVQISSITSQLLPLEPDPAVMVLMQHKTA